MPPLILTEMLPFSLCVTYPEISWPFKRCPLRGFQIDNARATALRFPCVVGLRSGCRQATSGTLYATMTLRMGYLPMDVTNFVCLVLLSAEASLPPAVCFSLTRLPPPFPPIGRSPSWTLHCLKHYDRNTSSTLMPLINNC